MTLSGVAALRHSLRRTLQVRLSRPRSAPWLKSFLEFLFRGVRDFIWRCPPRHSLRYTFQYASVGLPRLPWLKPFLEFLFRVKSLFLFFYLVIQSPISFVINNS